MTLPEFKRNPQCPKCGHDGIAFDYKAETTSKTEDFRPSAACGWATEVHFQEHIHLTCGRCTYGKQEPWIMAIAADPRRSVGFRPAVGQPA